MAYNITGIQGSLNPANLFAETNTMVDGLLFFSFVTALFFIMLMVLKRFPLSKAILSSSTVCFVLTLFLWYGQFIKFYYILVYAIIMALSAFYIAVFDR